MPTNSVRARDRWSRQSTQAQLGLVSPLWIHICRWTQPRPAKTSQLPGLSLEPEPRYGQKNCPLQPACIPDPLCSWACNSQLYIYIYINIYIYIYLITEPWRRLVTQPELTSVLINFCPFLSSLEEEKVEFLFFCIYFFPPLTPG